MNGPRALVVTGFGLNCDVETAHALELAGARAERVHLNVLVEKPEMLSGCGIFVIGGGFSWADEHGGGLILALRLRNRLGGALYRFVEKGGLVLGICNGFQVLVNLGLLPGSDSASKPERKVALIGNDCGNFRDQWIKMTMDPASPCVFTEGIATLDAPIRHGEGKFHTDPETLKTLEKNKQIPVRYALPSGEPAGGAFPHNPNGSLLDAAGICDTTGRVFGLMPHPEAFNHFTNHPDWTLMKERLRREGKPIPEEGAGLAIFRNAVKACG